jgi:hypothetical protein
VPAERASPRLGLAIAFSGGQQQRIAQVGFVIEPDRIVLLQR